MALYVLAFINASKDKGAACGLFINRRGEHQVRPWYLDTTSDILVYAGSQHQLAELGAVNPIRPYGR